MRAVRFAALSTVSSTDLQNSFVLSDPSTRRRRTLLCGMHFLSRQLAAWTAGRPAGAWSVICVMCCDNSRRLRPFSEGNAQCNTLAHRYRVGAWVLGCSGRRRLPGIGLERNPRDPRHRPTWLPALAPSGLMPVDVQSVPVISLTISSVLARADSADLMASSRFFSSVTNVSYDLFRFFARSG